MSKIMGMNKNKLIKFLAFIGIESDELKSHIQNSKFNLTDIILGMASEKSGETIETLNKWYSDFNY
jgi:hypothetical protein